MIPAAEPLRDARSRRAGSRLRLQWRRIDGAPHPERLFAALALDPRASFWLDSSDTDPATPAPGRCSVMGDASGPLAEVLRYDVRTGRWDVRGHRTHRSVEEGFVEHLRSRLAARAITRPADLPVPFTLGYVGALGYELKDEGNATPTHRSPHPDAVLVFADRAVVLDHGHRTVVLLALVDDARPRTVALADDWLATTARTVRNLLTTPAAAPEPPAADGHAPTASPATFRLDQDKVAYLRSIDRCLEHIRAGDSYEMCLTNTATGAPLTDPLATYLALRRTSPVPYGALLRFGELSVLSASPERFLRITASGIAQTRPIKGTRPRGDTPSDDARLRHDLATNPKDRAENLMIVDLLRNDLSRVCVPGTVATDDLFRVESYSHVHQLVSTVSGSLRPGLTAVDAVAAAFPGGSMTGAPKIRTIQITDALEHRARGLYSGAIGWFSLDGSAELSITIRTLVSDTTSTTFGVGGAIVADSDPEAELEETLVKARALLAALGARLG